MHAENAEREGKQEQILDKGEIKRVREQGEVVGGRGQKGERGER